MDPLPNRKRLGPDTDKFVWAANALPAFTWWTFDCQRSTGSYLIGALSQAEPELRLHLAPAMWSVAHKRGLMAMLSTQKQNAIKRAFELGNEAGIEALGRALEAAGQQIPLLSLAWDWLTKGIDAGKGYVTAKRQAENDVSFGGLAGEGRKSLGEVFARLVRATTHPLLPAVVVIEDAHLMDDGTLEFVKAVSQRTAGQPLLVIMTGWPHALPNPVFEQWRRWAAALGLIETISVPDLDTKSLVAIVRQAAPATSDTNAVQIAAKYQNPLLLKLFLGLSTVRRAVTSGAIDVRNLDLDALPADLEKMLSRRVDEFPPHVRTALEYATGTLPENWSVGPYQPSVVSSATRAIELEDQDRTADGLAQAAVRGLVISVSDIHYFREVIIADLMRHRLDWRDRRDLQDATITELRGRIAAARGDRYRINRASSATLHVAVWLTNLTPEPSTVDDVVARVSTAYALADAYRFGDAVEVLGTAWSSLLPRLHPDTLDISHDVAYWLGSAGRVCEAVNAFQKVLVDRQRVLGPEHPKTLATRHNLAHCLGEAGRVDEAINDFQNLLADMLQVLGPDDPSTLTARNVYARWLLRRVGSMKL